MTACIKPKTLFQENIGNNYCFTFIKTLYVSEGLQLELFFNIWPVHTCVVLTVGMMVIVQHSHGRHHHGPHHRVIQPCVRVSTPGLGFLVLVLIGQEMSFGEGAVVGPYGGVWRGRAIYCFTPTFMAVIFWYTAVGHRRKRTSKYIDSTSPHSSTGAEYKMPNLLGLLHGEGLDCAEAEELVLRLLSGLLREHTRSMFREPVHASHSGLPLHLSKTHATQFSNKSHM